jgi:hypothetical protein
VAEAGDTRTRLALQQQEISRHVLGGAGRAFGQDL